MNIEKLNSQNYSLKNIQLLLIFGIIPLMISCNSYKKNSSLKKSSSKVQLIIQTDSKIENIVFTKFGGFTEEDLMPFQDTMTITLNEPINDFYQLLCMKEGQTLIEQLWLQGEDIIIKASIKEDKFQIDTLINSPLYYDSKNTLAKYEALSTEKSNSEKANNFLLQEIKKNFDYPFSNILASKYIYANIDNPKNLKSLAALISKQEQGVKEHILSEHDNLNQLVNITTINFSEFKFIDVNGQKTSIIPKKEVLYFLDFWFTNCPPCLAEHKIMRTELAAFEQAGIDIIGISVDYEQEKWIDFLKDEQYEWDNYLEPNETIKSLSKYVGVTSFPTYLVVNGNGEILNKNNAIEKSINFLKTAKIIK